MISESQVESIFIDTDDALNEIMRILHLTEVNVGEDQERRCRNYPEGSKGKSVLKPNFLIPEEHVRVDGRDGRKGYSCTKNRDV